MIRIGTGGYNHRDWIGSFYPPEMGPARYLARYAEALDFCELRVSSYKLPGAAEAERVLGESEGRLFFTALAPVRLVEAVRREGKADLPTVGAGFLVGEGSPEIHGRDFLGPHAFHKREGLSTAARPASTSTGCGSADRTVRTSMRHRATARTSAASAVDRLLLQLREALLPYTQAGRFGGLVLPLPPDIAATEETLATVARFHDRLEGLPLLIEPCDGSWMDASVLGFLRTIGIGFVLADGPGPEGPSFGPDRNGPRLLPARRHVTFVPLTTQTAYVRFQGRDGGRGYEMGARVYPPAPPPIVHGGLPGAKSLASAPYREFDHADRTGSREWGTEELRAAAPDRLEIQGARGRGRRRAAVGKQGLEAQRGRDSLGEDFARTNERAVMAQRGQATRVRYGVRGVGGLPPAHESADRIAAKVPVSFRSGDQAAPSGYFYSWEELVGWLPTLRALAGRARDLFVVFDNPGQGSALENAQMLRRLMGAQHPAREARPDLNHEDTG